MGVTQYPAAVIDRTAQTLGYAQRTTDYSVAAGDVDIPELTVTVTVPAGRRLKITASGLMTTTANYYNVGLRIKEGTTTLGEDTVSTETGGDAVGLIAVAVVSPTPGQHTYKVSGFTKLGGAFIVRGATVPAYILVEDITGSNTAAPPSSVPVGQLAYASINLNQGGITTGNPGVPITGLSVNVVVPDGRVLKVSAQGHHWNSSANAQGNLRILMDGAQIAEQADRAVNVNTAQVIRAETTISPSAGAHVFTVNFSADSGGSHTFGGSPAFLLVEDITMTPAPATGSPSSTLAYYDFSTPQQTVTTTPVAIPNTSVTVTVPAGRRLRITATTWVANSTAPTQTALRIRRNGTVIQDRQVDHRAANVPENWDTSVIDTPSAGTHTYDLQGNTAAGTATLNGVGGKCFILVEDITATLAYGITSLPAAQITAGSFGAGDFTVTGNFTAYGQIVSAGAPSTNANNIAMQKTGAISASNILFAFSHRTNNTDLLFYGYNGTTFQNFMQFNYAALTMQLMQHTSLDQKDLRLHSAGNTDHKLKYMATAPGGSGDGPVLFGFSKGHLATTTGGESWQFAWQSDGWNYARAGFSAATLGAVWIRGQDGNAYATLICRNGGNRTGGNGASFNWDGTFRMYVEDTNVKNFIIPHPITPEEKYLIHTTLEGPENAVFYRGVGELVNGKVTINLPDYFEALVAEEGRSVQLTCIADDAEDEWCPVLHATYPTNGEFHVGLGSGMAIPDQRFWWEVKGIRRDVEPLLVEPNIDDVDVLGDGPYTYYRRKSSKAAPRVRVTQKVWPNKVVKPVRPRAGRHPDHPEVKSGE